MTFAVNGCHPDRDPLERERVASCSPRPLRVAKSHPLLPLAPFKTYVYMYMFTYVSDLYYRRYYRVLTSRPTHDHHGEIFWDKTSVLDFYYRRNEAILIVILS